MLNWNSVLQYVKGRLSLPSTFIEKADKELKDWIILTTLKEYSNYSPDWERTTVIVDNPNYKHQYRTNWYYFFDDEDRDIIGIRQCYFSIGQDYIAGMPPFGAFNFSGMKDWSLQVFKSRFFKPFSIFHYTYKFIPPNVVQVLSTNDTSVDNFVVEYERVHPADLRKIPAAHYRLFMDMALADVMIWIGGMRSMYGDGRITTPFGEIPLNGEQLKQEGVDLKRDLIEKLSEESLPPVIIDIE